MCISIRFVEIHCYINIILISLAAYISEQIEQSFLFWRATRYLSRTFIDWFTNQFCYDVLACRYWHTWKKYVKNIKLKHIVHLFLFSLDIPSSSSSIKNFIQCVTVDGQIGFVYISDVEPLHTQTPSKQTTNSSPTTMNHIFSRKTGICKEKTFSFF